MNRRDNGACGIVRHRHDARALSIRERLEQPASFLCGQGPGIADDCAAGLHHKSLRHTGAGFQAIERAFNSEIIAKGDRLAKTEIA